jgi:hypothetical protein
MIRIGKRSLRSLLGLASVIAAGFASPAPVAAEESGCGNSVVVQCNYGCNPGLCSSLGCTYYTCDFSYQCGFFMMRTTCGGGGET